MSGVIDAFNEGSVGIIDRHVSRHLLRQILSAQVLRRHDNQRR